MCSNFTQFQQRSTWARLPSLQQRFAISSSRRLLSVSGIQRSSCKPLLPLQKLSSSDRKRIDALRPGELGKRWYMPTYSHLECLQHFKQTPTFPLCKGRGLRGPGEKMIAAHKSCMLQNHFPVALLVPSVNCS